MPPSKQPVSVTTETTTTTSPNTDICDSSSGSEQGDEDDTVELKGESDGDGGGNGNQDEEEYEEGWGVVDDDDVSVEEADGGMTGDESEEEQEEYDQREGRDHDRMIGDGSYRQKYEQDIAEDGGSGNLNTEGDIDEDARSITSNGSGSNEDSDDPDRIDPTVAEEMEKFAATFKGFEKRYRLVNKIGEGTFSSVYKAEDLLYDRYDNSWDINYNDEARWASPPTKKRRTGRENTFLDPPRRPKFVAIKKIYVTSSPSRIQNELELLHDLSGCETVVPLITAFRYQDQVVAVLPYFKHVDFREYFMGLTIPHIRSYFRSLFDALAHVHANGIIHRDIKPTNFLYDYRYGRGVLVDFGLAEREGTDSQYCMCQLSTSSRKEYRQPTTTAPSTGYPKHDSRPSRRANRAGTRGFRAPEVLLKCTSQTTKIDIWSAGVILLTLLSRRFPFFNSSDDMDAMIEIATIFGKQKMKQCAALHGCIFEATIPTIGERGFTLEKIVLWATNRATTGSKDGKDDEKLPPDEALAVRFMQRCFELDPAKRISAADALKHEFLKSDAWSGL